MAPITIALDAMGGDHGLKVTLPAALEVLKKYPSLRLVLVGDAALIHSSLKKARGSALSRLRHGLFLPRALEGRITVHHATQQVENDESPARALRSKRDSSMRVAIDLVKQGTAQACISAGNTGALMATAHYVLRTLPGIDRPAIMASFPTFSGRGVRLLDLGANVDSSAQNLYQFAVMGSMVTRLVGGIEKPRVGLLNIGAEAIKGNEQVKQTALLLEKCPFIHYVGYVEGDGIFKEVADVVVCDGFVGNVVLKACEGSAKLISASIKQAFCQNIPSRAIGLLAKPLLNKVSKRLDPARFNGASLLGLQGIVVKSHGSAHTKAFAHAIEEAINEVTNNIPERIHQEIAARLEEATA